MVPDVDPLQLVAAIQGGARGLVLAGYGNGTLPKVVLEGIRALRTTGNHLPIARSSRVAAGAVTADGEIEDAAYGTLATGALGARRARLLLHLCTATTANAEEAMARFRELLELEARHPPKGRANGRTDRTPRAA
jgi:L-asparaginase